MKCKIKKRWFVVGAVGIGIFFFLFTARPLFFFDAELARDLPVHGNLQYVIMDIPDTEKDAIIDGFTKVKIPWIPEDASVISSKDAVKDPKLYINLVFGKQMFVNLFVYEDDSMAAYISPWQDSSLWDVDYAAVNPLVHVRYTVKNPEVLQEVVEIVVKYGREQGILPVEGA